MPNDQQTDKQTGMPTYEQTDKQTDTALTDWGPSREPMLCADRMEGRLPVEATERARERRDARAAVRKGGGANLSSRYVSGNRFCRLPESA